MVSITSLCVFKQAAILGLVLAVAVLSSKQAHAQDSISLQLAVNPTLAASPAALLALENPERADSEPEEELPLYFKVHATMGGVALLSFSSALAIGAASGNLGKLTDPNRCCPDGGDRDPTWRTVDRALVTVGIFSYSGAATMALFNLLIRDPPSATPRRAHDAHRFLAIAHGTAFITSAITGYIMSRSQASDPETFANAARIHVASNVLLVPLLSIAMANIAFE